MKSVVKRFSRALKHLLTTGEHNNHKPALLTAKAGVLVVGLLIIGFIGFRYIAKQALNQQGFLAEVYPAIVTSLTNTGRQAIDIRLKPLTYSYTLEAAAQKKAEDMIAKGYFAHQSPDGRQPWDWIKAEGYKYVYAGENLAINFSDSIDVYQAWMNSPGHRANILNPNYTEIGVATKKTYIGGRESIVVVQMFGSPQPGYYSMTQKLVSVATSTASTTTSQIQITENTTTTTSTLAVLGASTESIDSEVKSTEAFVGGLATSPRTISIVLYTFFVILINIAVIGIGRAEYHHNHKKTIFMAVFLVSILSLISLYILLVTPKVLLV